MEKAKELLANPAGEEIPLGTHPETGLEVVAKNGRYGPFVTELLPEDAPKKAKPRTGSLFKDMSLDTINLEQAVRLLSLPRVVGERRRRAWRSPRRTAATAPTSRRAPTRARWRPSSSSSTSPSSRRWRSTPSPSSAAAPRLPPPLKELGNDPVSGAAGRGEGRPVR